MHRVHQQTLCDICAEMCKCRSSTCPDLWTHHIDNIPELTIGEYVTDTSSQTRMVSTTSRKMLQNKPLEYHKELSNQVNLHSMFTCPNILLEFNSFHINPIVQNCHLIFSLKDVTEIVEIWRQKYAVPLFIHLVTFLEVLTQLQNFQV